MTDSASTAQRRAAVAAYDIVDVLRDDPVIKDLDGLCEAAAGMVDARCAVVNLLDDRFQHQVAACGTDPTPCRLDESMCQTTLAEGQDIYLRDASADARFADSPFVTGRLGAIRFYCSTILRTPTGQMLGTLCVFDDAPRDISDRQRRAQRILADQVVDVLELRLRTRQLERATEELTRSQDRLASFAGQVSHDLKAPITAIIGFTELLEDMDSIVHDTTARAFLARCSSAAKRMLAMIDDLLAFARIGGSLLPVPNDLASVVSQVVADLGPVAADAEVSVSGPDVVADRAQFRALLQNLISNAVRYRDDRPCVVTVTSERVGRETLLYVTDNGSGIPAERREEVLRPLFRLRKDVPGAGLGLAVCTRVASAHGGSLRLDGAPGGGTVATVTFPGLPD
ncbi:MAG TPA: GAF domain-containing sensor histidine kinase [Jatrophihabitans sp.]|jgi:signal transduction histidine kinase